VDHPKEGSRRAIRVSVLLAVVLAGCQSAGGPKPAASRPPKLVVAILVDGLGQHQLLKYRDRFGPGGFRRFFDDGAWFTDANYGHSTTLTAVGHGTWLTGAHPYRHGQVSNDWWDRKTKKIVYCTEDAEVKYLGEPTKERQGTSPKNLFVTTVGDELRSATNQQSRVFAVSLKDRGAILPAGKTGTAYMFSNQTGRFITSDYYLAEYPKWWTEFHAAKPQNRWYGKEWTPLHGPEAYAGTVEGRPYVTAPRGLGRKFPHKVTGGKPEPGPDYYAAMEGTPFGHELLADFARALIRSEGLGRNPSGAPDLFALSFSSHDFINHVFGPESKESQDDLLRLDLILAGFFSFLDEWVGLDHALVSLTADHGFSYSPEHCRDVMGLDAFRINAAEMLKRLNGHLGEKFGAGKYAAFWRLPTIWLDYDLIDERRLDRAAVEREAVRFLSSYPGVHSVYSRGDLSEGRVPDTLLGKRVSRSWHPNVSGDLLVIQKDGCFFTEGILLSFAAMHGSPWTYDTHVPLLFLGRPWVKGGTYLQAAQPADLAPTIARILSIPPPSGSEGRVLAEILR
jgi:predicted AlkP superfamily pyrophosphatase or phosphodiesterase